MGLVRLALKRLISQRALSVAMIVTFTAAGAALMAGPIYAAGAEQAIVFGSLQRASPLAKDVVVTTLAPPGFDPAAATAGIRARLRGLPIAQLVFEESSGVTKVSAAGGSSTARIAYRDGVFSAVALTGGRDPVGDDEVAIPQSMASSLGVDAGALIELDYSKHATVRVVGIYSTAGGSNPLVAAQPGRSPSTAPTPSAPLPILTTSAGFSAITASFGENGGFQMAWDAQLDGRGVTLNGLEVLAQREHQVAAEISAMLGASVSSDLSSLIPAIHREVVDSRAPIYLVVLEVALVCLGVLIGVGSL